MDATVAQLLLAVLSGGIVALLLTVFGGGGSVLAVPLLLYVSGCRTRMSRSAPRPPGWR